MTVEVGDRLGGAGERGENWDNRNSINNKTFFFARVKIDVIFNIKLQLQQENTDHTQLTNTEVQK